MNLARKQHWCSECGGPILVGESYQRAVGKFSGNIIVHKECSTCEEIRDWAEISVPCFCANQWGTLLERVKLMVDDVSKDVDGFDLEWEIRRYKLKLRAVSLK